MHGSAIKVMDSWALCMSFKNDAHPKLPPLIIYRRLLDAYGSMNIQILLQSYNIGLYPKRLIMIHKYVAYIYRQPKCGVAYIFFFCRHLIKAMHTQIFHIANIVYDSYLSRLLDVLIRVGLLCKH